MTVTLPFENTTIRVTGMLYGWYNSLSDHLEGDEAISLSLRSFAEEHDDHWSAPAVLLLVQCKSKLHNMLYHLLGPSIFYGGQRTVGACRGWSIAGS